MKGWKFYAVMPQERKSKSASKAYPHNPFTRAQLQKIADAGQTHECLALSIEDHGGRSWRYNPECVTLLHGDDLRNLGMSGVSLYYLRDRCVIISEDLARKLHPQLFRYLES